ncbi:MAG: contractile injection system tape measure protein [Cyanobacteriota bacterium]|nr:contractile injection system tape measure protein [Cyanobacteriota bacterium]
MSEKQQRHIIKKQIIELNLSSQQGAFELQNEVSQIYRHKVLPLIDDLLSQFSDSDTIHRVNSLEINLGNIDINCLEEEFIEKISEEIQRQLEDKFSSQTEFLTTTVNQTDISLFSQKDVGNSNNFSSQKYNDFKNLQTSDVENNRASQLEIFSYFLQTGTLPWWTENLSKKELEEYSDRLITNSPDAVKSIILESLKNAKQLQRLIYQFSDAILLKIAELFKADLVKFIANYNTDIKDIFKQLEQTRNIPEAKLRLDRWQAILLNLSSEGNTKKVDKLRLIQANLLHIASRNEINYPDFLKNLAAKIEHLILEGNKFKSTLPEILDNITTSNQDTDFIREKEQAKLLSREWQKLSINRKISPEDQQQINQIVQILQTLTNQTQEELNYYQSTAPEIIDNIKIPNQVTQFVRFEEQAKLLLRELQKLSINRQISPEDQQQINQLNHQIKILLNQINNLAPVENQFNLITRLNQILQIAQTLTIKIQQELNFNQSTQSTFSNYVDTFSDSDEIYIHNAGLILLWPFLNRFFVKIGLVQNNIFINIISTQRAALLLQYLIDNSTEIPEHTLPLNKILCGIDLLEPIDTNLEITEPERAECENLLSAVIQNWSILKNTSVEGLRKAFLQRNSILRIRDGNWLLQVERESYDILVDKIPWSIRVVKLPWMDNILYVEW